MLLFLVSNILGSSIQITTLPLVILSPLQASGLVFNSICATLILSEPFTRYSLVGTILVSIGAALIATFGALEEPAHTLDELLELLGKRPFLLWMGAQAMMVAGILTLTKLSQVLYPRTKNSNRMKMLRGISYGCVSGILSADCLLIAKSAVELLVRTIIDRVNQFNRWQSWVILLGLVFLALTQLFYLHRGLKLCSTSVLYPLVFCVYNIIAILDGLIYYRQTSRLSPLHSGLIALGTFILLSGVLCLSWRLHDDDQHVHVPPAPPSALTPGLGYVETDSEEEDVLSSCSIPYCDAEPASTGSPAEEGDEDKLPPLRRRTLSEEIWGELQDSREEDDMIPPDERTGLLRPNRRRKRSGYGFSRGSSSPRGERGEWWKLRWWKGSERGDGDSGGGGGGV